MATPKVGEYGQFPESISTEFLSLNQKSRVFSFFVKELFCLHS